MNRNSLPKIFLSVAAGVLLAHSAQAQILFFDNFNVTAGGDANTQYNNGTRQTGTLAPSPYQIVFPGGNSYYVQTGNPSGQLLLAGASDGRGGVSNNLNFNTSTPTMTLSYDVQPARSGDNGFNPSSWSSFTFGTASHNPGVNDPNDGIGFLYRGSAGYQIFQGGVQIADGTVGTGNASFNHIQFTLSTTDGTSIFSGSDVQVKLSINGTLVTTITQPGGFTDNVTSFAGEADDPGLLTVSYIENFAVSVPEPGTNVAVALIASVGAWVMLRRRANGVRA